MSTKIEWTDETWNPVHGCTKISAGCKNCYAERMSKRLAGRHGYPSAPDNFNVTLRPDRLGQPLKWRKPRRVFVCSMSDLFHDDVPFDFIDSVFTVAKMSLARNLGHVFQFLTKRPARMLEYWNWWVSMWEPENAPKSFPDNCWLGVTAENQQTADERIPLLLQTPAAVRFVSCEPLLGRISLNRIRIKEQAQYRNSLSYFNSQAIRLDWVIAGGETGPGARPMHPTWARSLRDQCNAAGVPFFFKSWGEWWPVNHDYTTGNNIGPSTKSCWIDIHGNSFPRYSAMFRDPCKMYRIGNKRAGRLLDGRKWHEMPERRRDDRGNSING